VFGASKGADQATQKLVGGPYTPRNAYGSMAVAVVSDFELQMLGSQRYLDVI
jgi:hypothetical protein